MTEAATTTGAAETRPARATLREVARRAGVSIATVSNVVNGKLDMMSPETREAVLRVIRETGYRPSAVARGLRSARRRLVGLIVIDDNPSFLTDPFTTNIVAGLSNVLSADGHGVAVVGMPERAVDSSFLVRNDETDALAIIPSGPRQRRARLYDRMRDLGRPLVLFQDDPGFGPEADLLLIDQDDHGGARLLATRQIARGARRIVFLSPGRAWPAIEARLAGVKAAIAEAAGTVQLTEISCGRETIAETAAALEAHVGQAGLPDTVMAGNDQMGIAALRWAAERGIEVPRGLRITGFNAFDFREYSTPTLTSVRSSAYAMGEAAGREILARLDGGRFARRRLTLPVALVEGGSD